MVNMGQFCKQSGWTPVACQLLHSNYTDSVISFWVINCLKYFTTNGVSSFCTRPDCDISFYFQLRLFGWTEAPLEQQAQLMGLIGSKLMGCDGRRRDYWAWGETWAVESDIYFKLLRYCATGAGRIGFLKWDKRSGKLRHVRRQWWFRWSFGMGFGENIFLYSSKQLMIGPFWMNWLPFPLY